MWRNIPWRAAGLLCILLAGAVRGQTADKDAPDPSCPRTNPSPTFFPAPRAQWTAELQQRYKLWPLAQVDDAASETLPFFAEALAAIWDNQHPVHCSAARFLILLAPSTGFGSAFHQLAESLAIAMKLGRVMLLEPQVHFSLHWQVDNDHCRRQQRTNLECYVEPLSSCTVADAMASADASVLTLPIIQRRMHV